MENQIFSSFSMTMNNDFFFWYLILQLKDEAYVDPLFRPLPPLPLFRSVSGFKKSLD